jgi:hypothetical protein
VEYDAASHAGSDPAHPADHDAFERWQHGGRLEGVHFPPDAAVVVLEGDHAGRAGHVVSLQALAPEPVYVVALADGDDVGVVQSGLRAAVRGDGG